MAIHNIFTQSETLIIKKPKGYIVFIDKGTDKKPSSYKKEQ